MASKKFPALVLLLFLSGCSLFEPKVVYQDRWRDRPVLVAAPPPAPAKVDGRLDLPVYHLSATSTKDEIAKAYVDSIDILSTAISQIRAALKPFKDASDAAPATGNPGTQ